MHRLLSCLQLAATLLAAVALVAARQDRTVCNAEGECQPFQFGQTEDKDLVVEAIHSPANDILKNAMEALLHWTVTSTSDDAQPMEQWFAPDVLVEAEDTPNVPWRGRYEGASAAAAFFLRLRQGLFPAPADNSTTGLQWATAAAGPGRFVVRWEPSHDTVADVDASVQLRRVECGAWLIGEESITSGGRLARLQVHHTHSLACAAAFRSRAQRVFDAAFAHFFRLDYAAFRQSFDPDVTMTWHGDAPLGKVFRGNQDGLSDYIRTRVQIFLQTSVEFDPIIANETSASYYVVFRPLTIRATGQEFSEVRGLLVVHINEAGLIDSYQMTVLDRRVNLALAHAVKE